MPLSCDRSYFRGLALICSIAIAPGDLLSRQSPSPSQEVAKQQTQFSKEQLDSLIAPIALYQDSLLAQVLAAATYPLQIVMAARWVKQNSNLKGKALVEAAGKQDWDPSIQALVAFPTVLQMMDQSLDWTTALGNAFLAQQADLMAAAQRMRMKAQQAGQLQSNTQQQVETTNVGGQQTVVIQSADPQVIYVPSYDPAAVYGAAPEYYPYPEIAYPTYPVGAAAVSFGLGVAVGAIFNGCCGGGWGWGWGFNWGAHPSLYVNNNFFNHNGNNFVNRGSWGNAYRGNGQTGWNHNPRYRGSVPYPNRDVANRFNGGRSGSLRPAQLPSNIGNIRPPGSAGVGNGFRGNGMGSGNGIGNRQGIGRGGASTLPANPGGINRPGGGRVGASQLPANRPGQRGQWGGWGGSRGSQVNRGGAFRGGSAGQARGFSNRGARSMGGGGFRGGGGGGGRRGGGRRR
jgi:Protein of unknown function (DUF3300)